MCLNQDWTVFSQENSVGRGLCLEQPAESSPVPTKQREEKMTFQFGFREEMPANHVTRIYEVRGRRYQALSTDEAEEHPSTPPRKAIRIAAEDVFEAMAYLQTYAPDFVADTIIHRGDICVAPEKKILKSDKAS